MEGRWTRQVKADQGVLVLGGLDVIDGTPCLDIKPYLPSFEAIDAQVSLRIGFIGRFPISGIGVLFRLVWLDNGGVRLV